MTTDNLPTTWTHHTNSNHNLCEWTLADSVTEIPFVDESTEQELLSLLGDWYKPKSIKSLFSSMPSDAVFFSS